MESKTHWKQDHVFPVIVRHIDELHKHTKRFVTSGEIADALLRDPETFTTLEGIDSHMTREWLAGNMVAWFSQRITVENSEWMEFFERTKINGQWAYRPTV